MQKAGFGAYLDEAHIAEQVIVARKFGSEQRLKIEDRFGALDGKKGQAASEGAQTDAYKEGEAEHDLELGLRAEDGCVDGDSKDPGSDHIGSVQFEGGDVGNRRYGLIEDRLRDRNAGGDESALERRQAGIEFTSEAVQHPESIFALLGGGSNGWLWEFCEFFLKSEAKTKNNILLYWTNASKSITVMRISP